MTWNSTLKPGKPLVRKKPLVATKPMARSRAPKMAANRKKGATAIEKAHMSLLAEMGCILCRHLGLGATPAEIHHLRHGAGAGQRSSHMKTIPLCPEHHRGNTGFHGLGRRAFEREYGLTEMDLWEMTQKNNPATVDAVPGLSTARL